MNLQLGHELENILSLLWFESISFTPLLKAKAQLFYRDLTVVGNVDVLEELGVLLNVVLGDLDPGEISLPRHACCLSIFADGETFRIDVSRSHFFCSS